MRKISQFWWAAVIAIACAAALEAQTFQGTLILGSYNSGTGTLTCVTTGTGTTINVRTSPALTVYFQSVGTTSGGAIVFEESSVSSAEAVYAGTWSTITTVNASTFSGGAQFAYHIAAPTPLHFLRARVSSNITGGGTVCVRLVGN